MTKLKERLVRKEKEIEAKERVRKYLQLKLCERCTKPRVVNPDQGWHICQPCLEELGGRDMALLIYIKYSRQRKLWPEASYRIEVRGDVMRIRPRGYVDGIYGICGIISFPLRWIKLITVVERKKGARPNDWNSVRQITLDELSKYIKEV